MPPYGPKSKEERASSVPAFPPYAPQPCNYTDITWARNPTTHPAGAGRTASSTKSTRRTAVTMMPTSTNSTTSSAVPLRTGDPTSTTPGATRSPCRRLRLRLQGDGVSMRIVRRGLWVLPRRWISTSRMSDPRHPRCGYIPAMCISPQCVYSV